METMSYNKIRKNKTSSMGVYAFFLFIILGTGLVAYSIINEPEPVVLGKDPLKEINVNENDTAETISENTTNIEDITYDVVDIASSSKEGNFSINMTLPKVSINNEEVDTINSQIVEHYNERSKTLASQMKNAENKFTYKVTYKEYENKVGDKKILSITVHERIIDNAKGTSTTDRVDAYNIDLAEKKILTQEEAALEVLGSNYSSLISEQVKSTVIAAKMAIESKYDYTITGMEQYYIKENKFHILLNEGEVVDKSYGVVDVTITK